MIDIATFDRLRAYETTSWAIWSETGDNGVIFFRSHLSKLHAGVVFAGLNRSGVWSGFDRTQMPNFHKHGHVGDRRLKRHIQDAGLQNMLGGLMTDISDKIESKSGLVEVNAIDSVNLFKGKIDGVDCNSNRHIICFGDKVFVTFRRGLGIKNTGTTESVHEIKTFSSFVNGETWHFYRVWHYSNYGKLLSKSEVQLPLQLGFINQRINSHLLSNI